jgi:hypothetical protein
MGSMAPPLSAGSIGDYSLDASERVGVGRMGVFSRVVESSAGGYGRSCRDDEDEECRRHTTGLGGADVEVEVEVEGSVTTFGGR